MASPNVALKAPTDITSNAAKTGTEVSNGNFAAMLDDGTDQAKERALFARSKG